MLNSPDAVLKLLHGQPQPVPGKPAPLDASAVGSLRPRFHARCPITDAAKGERAEWVMLNKGPHILEAVAVLDDVLRRMQDYQTKESRV